MDALQRLRDMLRERAIAPRRVPNEYEEGPGLKSDINP